MAQAYLPHAYLPKLFALAILFSAFFPAYAQTGEQQPALSPSQAATASPSSPGDSTGLIAIKAPKPSYPVEAANKGVQGKVWIQLLISETGDVKSADIISGDPDLARAAQEAMKKWKFKPYIHNGKPVKVNTKMPFDFAFKDNITDVPAPPDSSANASAKPAGAAAASDESTSGEKPRGALPQMVRVSPGIAEGLLQYKVEPSYPFAAREGHIQGDVVLKATIGTDGLIHHLKAVSGHPMLVEAAKGAVEQWRYRPFVIQGSPAEMETTIKIQFHM